MILATKFDDDGQKMADEHVLAVTTSTHPDRPLGCQTETPAPMTPPAAQMPCHAACPQNQHRVLQSPGECRHPNPLVKRLPMPDQRRSQWPIQVIVDQN